MAAHSEELFRNAVNSVFNSWTALQLAVEHGMGGPQGNTKALSMLDAVIALYRNKGGAVDWQDVADLLSDLMDSEFNTICEDDSTDEVGLVIWELQRLCALGDTAGLEAEISKLPSCKEWLKRCVPQDQAVVSHVNDRSSEPEDNDEQMETGEVDADPGWTQVTRRKKGSAH